MRLTRPSPLVRAVLAATLLVFAGLAAFGDRLELRNGDVITGTIRLMDAEKVVIETAYGLLRGGS